MDRFIRPGQTETNDFSAWIDRPMELGLLEAWLTDRQAGSSFLRKQLRADKLLAPLSERATKITKVGHNMTEWDNTITQGCLSPSLSLSRCSIQETVALRFRSACQQSSLVISGFFLTSL